MNRYQRGLLIGSVIAIVGGGVLALWAKRQAESAGFVNELVVSMGGLYDDSDASGFYGWMWAGIVVAVLGAVALIGYLVVRASAEKAPVAAD